MDDYMKLKGTDIDLKIIHDKKLFFKQNLVHLKHLEKK